MPRDRGGAAGPGHALGRGLSDAGRPGPGIRILEMAGPARTDVERAYRQSTRALAVALMALGVAMVVSSLARGGGPLALGVVLGVAFALLGAARLYLAGRHSAPRGEA